MVAIVLGIPVEEVKRVLRNVFLTADLSAEDRALVELEIEREAPKIARKCRYRMAAD